MKRSFLISVFLLLGGLFATAQNSTQGKEFWFSFMRNGLEDNGLNELDVMISAKRACTGTIQDCSSPPNWSIDFSVGANGVEIIQLPFNNLYHKDEVERVVSHKSAKLIASDTISVYISNHAKFSFDASYVLPKESLGTEYILQSARQSIANGAPRMKTSSFLIIALEDNTQVSITPSVLTLGGHQAGQPFSVTLDAGQSYFVRSNHASLERDFSGTTVGASKKVAVFNGNTLTQLFDRNEISQDHVFEQAISVDKWGKQFAPTMSLNRIRDLVKVTSSADGDTVWINGNYVTTLGFGRSYEFSLYNYEGSCFIETSEPSTVYLYNTSGNDPIEGGDTSMGDPSMVLIPPVEQRIYDITFCTFNNEAAALDNHYVNVVVLNEGVGEVYLDGTVIDAAEFQPVNGTDEFSYVRKEIQHGIHHLSCLSGLLVHIYGFARAKGYAYCAGANMITLNSRLYVNDVLSSFYRDGVLLCVDNEADFKVETNYTITNVTWDFGLPNLGHGETVSQSFPSVGDYEVNAYIEGVTTFSSQPVFDTLSVEVHVGAPIVHEDEIVACNVDSVEYFGVYFKSSGNYSMEGQSIYGCDSSYYLTLEMEFTPNFEIVGTHWPIGGSETYISLNDYAIRLLEPRAHIDTVLWQIDCPNWYVEPLGEKGKECTLYIFSYLLEPITLHAWTINRCDTVHEEFFIQTSYFGVDEPNEKQDFVIYPNPSDGHLTLCFGDLTGKVEVKVYDGLGRNVDAFSVDADLRKEMAYMVPAFSSGLYSFVLNAKGKTIVRKVNIMR